ncbi:retrovirus-related pol polyprotein from transposon TNT 1-94 [Tanacetum coccineum]
MLSGSQLLGNTRNDRIQQTPSSNSKNKVEAHPRKVKSSMNKRNGTVKVNGSASVQNSKKHDNSDYVYIHGDVQSSLVFGLRLLCKAHDRRAALSSTNFISALERSKSSLLSTDTLDYWVKCLRSKDEAPAFIINFLKMIQVRLKETVCRIRTDNGTEFVNQTLREYYEKVGISHETSVARSLQQNGVVERRNRTLIEAAHTMLIYAKAPLFLWAEAVATTCYTQNRSMIRRRHGKTPYELLHDKPPDLSYLHVFGALCYPTNDNKNLGKLQPKADVAKSNSTLVITVQRNFVEFKSIIYQL